MSLPKQREPFATSSKHSRRENVGISLLFLTALLPMSACNQVFYQPTRKVYDLPIRHQFAYKEHRVAFSKEQNLVAWEITPTTPKVKGTILHFHGNAENMTSHFRYMLPVVRLGYRVVTFDYRGYGFSDGIPSREGLRRDAILMIDFIHEQEAYKDGPLHVIAQSLGGAVAVAGLASRPDHRFSTLILDSTFASYRLMARSVLDRFWISWLFQWPLSFLVTNHANPVDAVTTLKIPTLFVHGDADRIVPLEQGKMLYDAVPSKCKQFLRLPGEGHTTIFRSGHPSFRRIVTFLRGNELCQK